MPDSLADAHNDRLTKAANDPRFVEALETMAQAGLLRAEGEGHSKSYFITDLGVRAASVLVGVFGKDIEAVNEVDQRRLEDAVRVVTDALASVRLMLVNEGR